ncbi:MAG: 1-deoxy-D-xylulose-5-phosphate synthase [Desulfobulbaceae bacterium]|jgi:1-deoxy-D-xylulose-5-phosphate synthase|nr:1-deoxy-D-xylulose-5-phosphate synthase [Desulfobulbaceae bacterium]
MPDTESLPSLLAAIASPADIRDLSNDDLRALADDIRRAIIKTVSQTGGHLAPSLGVVELTLALHKVFNTPEDRLLWDVGHQSYAHKLLTGRQGRFATLRQYHGLSGFPKPSESVYDPFVAGHSSTSISAALGMAMATSIQGRAERAIAVIGDGALTGGMAFEALNQAGHLDARLVVIVNDNEMSISPNVGAFSSFLSRKLSGRTMRRIKRHVEGKLLELSSLGENILNLLKKSEDSMRCFFTPGMLFQAMKFDYIGPVDGHDLDQLISTLERVRDSAQDPGPVLVHVLTKKGKGYRPAEEKPGLFHGIGPFDVQSGLPLKKNSPPSPTQVFGDTIRQLARQDERVVAITAAMTQGTGLAGFAEEFPDRFFDVGIAEQHAVTFAAGLASEGMRPVVAVYSTFLQRAIDQVIHDVCLQKLPVTFAIDRAGVVGDDGPTHHGVFDMALLRAIPDLILMAPKDENELRHMLFTAISCNQPAALRYPRGAGQDALTDEPPHQLEIGKGELLREGGDLLLLPVGNRVYPAMAAAEELARLGVSAAVINPRFIKPLDTELIGRWAGRVKRVITIEDGCGMGGFGGAVLELFAARRLWGVETRILAHPDHFVEHGPQKILWSNSGVDSQAIVTEALLCCERCQKLAN